VLTALAGNGTADVTPASMKRLVDYAKTVAALGQPLSQHPRLTTELAESLYLWVGQALRSAIVSRFDVDAAKLDAAIAASVAAVPPPKPAGPSTAELKLVIKLAAAGQLKPGYLLKALREHQLGLFEAALAKLGGFKVEDVHRAVTSAERPELVRQCNGGLPGGGAEGARRAISAFGPFSAEIAASAFRQAVAAV